MQVAPPSGSYMYRCACVPKSVARSVCTFSGHKGVTGLDQSAVPSGPSVASTGAQLEGYGLMDRFSN